MRKMTWVALAGGALVLGPVQASGQINESVQDRLDRSGDVTRAADEAETASKRAEQQAGEAEKKADEAAKQAEQAKQRASEADDDLDDRVEAKLEGDSQLEGSDIDAEANDQGVVTLTGTVPSAKAQKRAVQMARDTEGVQKVDDQLEVKPAK
jgi:hyperosmotically inducible protein